VGQGVLAGLHGFAGSSGSAKARARASALAWSGMASDVAAISAA
jgi:hypothetical protein